MQNLTSARKNEFIAKLIAAGGSQGNSGLRKALGWDEEIYSRVHGRLLEEGRIRSGRGRGGTVILIPDDTPDVAPKTSTLATPASADQAQAVIISRERDLYTAGLKGAIETWFKRKGVEHVVVEPTHSRGSKSTGGTFTRPDYTAALRKEYRYVATNVEVATFEIKPRTEINIVGVMEALAHRESAHRAFVFYAASQKGFDIAPEARRIVELASKYGIGVLVSDTPEQIDTWIEVVEEERNSPDPDRLERLIGDLPDGEVKKKLSQWK